MAEPLADYLRAMARIRASGEATGETSYYDALSGLLTAVGATLRPAVCPILTLKDRGAGLPDGGLFVENQLRSHAEGKPILGTLPARGALEVKPPSHDVRQIAESEQVGRYLGKYGQVLVTNYREFLLVGQGKGGQRRLLESYSIARDEVEF
jgi:hypothetical protein